MNAYISIGNTDNKLTQQEWAEFIRETEVRFDGFEIQGSWFSRPDAPWQNACWCIEVDPSDLVPTEDLKAELRWLAGFYRQDSIAWAQAKTEFLSAPGEYR